MKKMIIIICLPVLVLIMVCCKNNPAEPPIITPVEVTPGSRNYTWDITTLDIEPRESSMLSEIWGTSPRDIWAVGTASLSRYGVWHFNGLNWQYGTNESTYGQTAIWGSSPNDIWIGNSGGILFRYDGVKWKYYTQLKLPEYDNFCIQKIWGVSASEVYLIGAKINGYDPREEVGIFKFDGTTWTRIVMPKISKNGVAINKDKNGDLIFNCDEYENNRSTMYSWNGKELKILFVSNDGQLVMNRIGDSMMIVYGNKIYNYNKGDIKLVCDFAGVSESLGLTCGRNEKDIFGTYYSGTGKIFHYNGSDLKEIYSLSPRVYPTRGFIFEKDVYILLQDFSTGKTKILHGKLND
jgi:hypothetical protein